MDGQTFDLLTAEFSAGPMLAPESEAFPTSIAALADAPVLEQPRIIQVNRVVIQPPVRGDQLLTQDNRLYCQARIRDFTGGHDVEVVETAVPELFGLTSKEEVMEHLNAGTLKPNLARVNARGILKMANGTMKIYIAKISESPLGAKVSAEAMRLSVGLSSIAGDVVMAVPADRVLDDPLLGLAVRADEADPIGAHNRGRAVGRGGPVSGSAVVPHQVGECALPPVWRGNTRGPPWLLRLRHAAAIPLG